MCLSDDKSGWECMFFFLFMLFSYSFFRGGREFQELRDILDLLQR